MAVETKEYRAEAKFQRVSPQKARLVLDLIKGRGVQEAMGPFQRFGKLFFLGIEAGGLSSRLEGPCVELIAFFEALLRHQIVGVRRVDHHAVLNHPA